MPPSFENCRRANRKKGIYWGIRVRPEIENSFPQESHRSLDLRVRTDTSRTKRPDIMGGKDTRSRASGRTLVEAIFATLSLDSPATLQRNLEH